MSSSSTKQNENNVPVNMDHEVKKAFINQFAENQNHQQRLFVHFLSVVLVSLVAYAFVYSNTSNYYKKTGTDKFETEMFQGQDTSVFLQPFEAKTFDTVKDKNGNILSYGKIHLVSIYLFAQMVLLVLGLTLLHMGYSFRRDQQVVHTIRIKSLGEDEFKKIFSTGFTGLGKRFTNYLPNFYSILFFAILALQLIIYWSIYIYLDTYPEIEGSRLIIFISDFFGYNITYRAIKFILSLPILFQAGFYFLYFIKYNTKVNNIQLKNQLSITSLADKNNLRKIGRLCLLFGVIKFVFLLWFFSLSLMSSAIISFFAACANLFAGYIKMNEKNGHEDIEHHKKSYGKNLSNFIFYLFASLGIIVITIYSIAHRNHRITVNTGPLIIFCTIMTIIIYSVSELHKNKYIKTGNNALAIVDQLKLESYIFFIMLGTYFIIFFSKIKFFDYALSLALGSLAFAWSVRSLMLIVDTELQRNNSEKPLLLDDSSTPLDTKL